MAIELRVPALGESVTQATVGAWLKKEGDPVQLDELVVEVESEKATVALPAPAAGVLRRILKAIVGIAMLPDTVRQIRRRDRDARAMLAAGPKIPKLPETLAAAR